MPGGLVPPDYFEIKDGKMVHSDARWKDSVIPDSNPIWARCMMHTGLPLRARLYRTQCGAHIASPYGPSVGCIRACPYRHAHMGPIRSSPYAVAPQEHRDLGKHRRKRCRQASNHAFVDKWQSMKNRDINANYEHWGKTTTRIEVWKKRLCRPNSPMPSASPPRDHHFGT